MTKKGITLIELVVSMAVFMVIATIAVGAFVSTVRMKALTSTMRESQQKLRIASEMITRLSRQANKVERISESNILLHFNISDEDKYAITEFNINTVDESTPALSISECYTVTNKTCEDWNDPQYIDLLGGSITLDAGSEFSIDNSKLPPYLTVKLIGSINGLPEDTKSPYYTDNLNLTTSVVLENLK